MTEQEFLKKQGEYFHLRLFRYYYLSTTDVERKKQQNTDVLFFEFPEGRYSIRYNDLKMKADTDAYMLNLKNKTKKIVLPELKLKK